MLSSDWSRMGSCPASNTMYYNVGSTGEEEEERDRGNSRKEEQEEEKEKNKEDKKGD